MISLKDLNVIRDQIRVKTSSYLAKPFAPLIEDIMSFIEKIVVTIEALDSRIKKLESKDEEN